MNRPITSEEDLSLALGTLSETLEALVIKLGDDEVARERCIQASDALLALTVYIQGVVK